MLLKKLYCWLTEHDDETQVFHLDFVGTKKGVYLGRCKRCWRQWWMIGEVGQMKGVRIIKSEEE